MGIDRVDPSGWCRAGRLMNGPELVVGFVRHRVSGMLGGIDADYQARRVRG